jgi:hypothetical protein
MSAMPRGRQVNPGGYCYHVLNRANGRLTLFGSPRLWMLTALLASALPVCCGCSKEAPSPVGQGTPEEVLFKAHKAILAGDRDEFKDCYTGPDGYRDLLDVLFDFVHASYRFQDKLEATFGPDAWLQYREAKVEKGFTPNVMPRDANYIDTLDIVQENGMATYFDPLTCEEETLVKEDDIWRIRIGSEIDPQEAVVLFRKMIEVVEAGMAEMDKENVSVADIKARTGDMLFRALRELK